MPIKHTVVQGDSISRLAEKYGFAPETLWHHPDNEALRLSRRFMDVLQPGDVVSIPDKRPKTVERATEQLHKFWRRGVPAKLRLRLLTAGRPRGGEEYRLIVDDQEIAGRTDSDGWLEHAVPNAAQTARLLLADGEAYELRIGHLNPVTSRSGARMRLLNLGYLPPGEESEEAFAAALRTLQAKYEREPTGALDEATQKLLADEYGC